MGDTNWKMYVAPGLALLVVVVWYFVIQPRLTDVDTVSESAPPNPHAAEAKP